MTPCEYNANDVARMDYDDVRDAMRALRVKPLRKSAFAARAGERLIKQGGLGAELWPVLEQTTLACLDIGNFDYAKTCIDRLESQFGEEAKKVLRLRGIFYEANQRYADADRVYSKLLATHPTDKCTIWRKVAMAKAQGRTDEAVQLLNGHLKLVNAEEAHQELLRIHLSLPQPDYEKAASTCEELILMHTSNYGFLMLYAEIQYSMARGKSSFILARKYYAEAVVANEGANNTRSVWGLLQTCKQIQKQSSLTTEEQEENENVMKWAATRLRAIYAKVGSSMQDNANLLLDSSSFAAIH